MLSFLGASPTLTQTPVEATAAANAQDSAEVVEKVASWDGTVFRIEDAKSRVSLAAVKLSVSDLKPEGGNLVGEYTIRVPLMESKNDQGKIILPLNISMDDIGIVGATLRGRAVSYNDSEKTNTIVCRIFPGEKQTIELDITTQDRTIQFESRYMIVEQPTDT